MKLAPPTQGVDYQLFAISNAIGEAESLTVARLGQDRFWLGSAAAA